MRTVTDETWKRRGMGILWNPDELIRLADPSEIVSLRTFFRTNPWPDDLPSQDGNAMVVAGLDGALDALERQDAESWLEHSIKPRVLDFQHHYQGQAALIFWIPAGKHRLQYNHATSSYLWRCQPQSTEQLPLGRCLWAGAESDVLRILDGQQSQQDADGSAWIGLYHPRIS